MCIRDRAKKGLPPKKVDTSAVTNYEEAVQRKEDEVARRGERAKEIKESTEYYNQNAKPGSLAAKANMVKICLLYTSQFVTAHLLHSRLSFSL